MPRRPLPFSLAIAGLVLGYVWVVEPHAPRWSQWVCAALVLALSGWHAWQTGDWGVRRAALGPALRWTALATVSAVALLLFAGALLGTLHSLPLRWTAVLSLAAWSAGQQFALQTVVLREAEARLAGGRAIWIAAALFAALHLPNPLLVPLTFFGAAIWCTIYRRYPHLLPLALSHAVSTLALLAAFDESTTGRLRIGLAYLRFLGERAPTP